MGKAPNTRLLYAPEKSVDHVTLGLESSSSAHSVPSGKPQQDYPYSNNFSHICLHSS